MEEDIIKISNDYYYYTDKYDRRLYNIIDRFDCKSNKLYIDLRNRENDYKRLNRKVDYLYNYLKMCYNAPIISHSTKNIDIDVVFGDTGDATSDYDEYTCRYMLVFLKVYTFFVIGMLINYGF
jgi:hypothetical protein